MKPRRRSIIKIIVLLAAGATLNVAVAWGCLIHACYDNLRPAPLLSQAPMTAADRDWWLDRAPTGMVPPTQIDEYGNVGFLERRLGTEGPQLPGVNAPTLFEQSTRMRIGWPSYALYGEWFSLAMPQTARGFGQVRKGCIDGRKHVAWLGVPVFPFVPLWPGFAINTVFYAGVLWVLFCGPFALRRMIRRRRGRCAACNYPIGQSPVCTECGAPVTPTPKAINA